MAEPVASASAMALTAALTEHLEGLEVRPAELRRDPSGESWLGSEWAARVAEHRELQATVRTFVDEELALADSFRGPADVFFTAQVLASAAPVEIVGVGLPQRYRRWILAGAYALALAFALALGFGSLALALRPGTLHTLVFHGAGPGLGLGSGLGSGLGLGALSVEELGLLIVLGVAALIAWGVVSGGSGARIRRV